MLSPKSLEIQEIERSGGMFLLLDDFLDYVANNDDVAIEYGMGNPLFRRYVEISDEYQFEIWASAIRHSSIETIAKVLPMMSKTTREETWGILIDMDENSIELFDFCMAHIPKVDSVRGVPFGEYVGTLRLVLHR